MHKTEIVWHKQQLWNRVSADIKYTADAGGSVKKRL
jgi:hypothetical protein